jgi:hypothetical protein
MNQTGHFPNEPVPPAQSRHHGFIPLVLVAVSLIIILSWELIIGNQARANGGRLREQQAKLVDQSKQIQSGLEKIARDLIDVARSGDDDAKALVTKYGINVSSPAPAASPAASPASSP